MRRRANIIRGTYHPLPSRWEWGSREQLACEAQAGAQLVHEQATRAYDRGDWADAARYRQEAAERYREARRIMGLE